MVLCHYLGTGGPTKKSNYRYALGKLKKFHDNSSDMSFIYNYPQYKMIKYIIL